MKLDIVALVLLSVCLILTIKSIIEGILIRRRQKKMKKI